MKGDIEVILMAATCGSHGKDCPSCKSAQQMNDNTIAALRAENERLTDGLQRLSSPLAFDLPKAADKEARIRMFYAEAVLEGSDDPERDGKATLYNKDKADAGN